MNTSFKVSSFLSPVPTRIAPVSTLQFADWSEEEDDEVVTNEPPTTGKAPKKGAELLKSLQTVIASKKPFKFKGTDAALFSKIAVENGWSGGALSVHKTIQERAEKMLEKGEKLTFQTVTTDGMLTARASRNNGVYASFEFKSPVKNVPAQNCILPRGTDSIEPGQTVTITVTKSDLGWSYNAEF